MLRKVKRSPDDVRKGQVVQFRLRDIHLPDPTAVLHELHDGDVLKGKVVGVSRDARDEGSIFVVVEVPHLRPRCILPLDRILRVVTPVRS
jgi:hypothetical protein